MPITHVITQLYHSGGYYSVDHIKYLVLHFYCSPHRGMQLSKEAFSLNISTQFLMMKAGGTISLGNRGSQVHPVLSKWDREARKDRTEKYTVGVWGLGGRPEGRLREFVGL